MRTQCPAVTRPEKNSQLNRFCISSLLGAGFVLLQHGQAWGAEYAAPTELEEVIVTAERRRENAQDIPIAMSVFSADFIKRNIKDVYDVANYAPNFEIAPHQGFAQSNFASMRGIGAAENNLPLDATSILIYNDGIPMGAQFGSVTPQWDLERIEVLRGPQGTLFGRNAVGGTVQFVSAAPTDQLDGYGQVTVGEFDLKHVEAALSGPVADNVKVRVSGVYHDRGGDLVNTIFNVEQGEQYWSGARGIVDWQVTDNFDARFKAQVFEGDADIHFFNAAPSDLFLPATRQWFAGVGLDPDLGRKSNYEKIQSNIKDPYDKFKLTLGEVDLNYDFGPVGLTAIGGYVEGDSDFLRDGPLGYKNTYEQWNGELRLTSQTESTFQWIAGTFYQSTDGGQHFDLFADNTAGVRAPDGLTPRIPRSNIVIVGNPGTLQELETYAFFLHTTFQWTDRLKTTQAVRYTYEEAANDITFFSQFEIPLSPGVTITPGTGATHVPDVLSFANLSHAEQRASALTIIADPNQIDAAGNVVPFHLQDSWEEVTWRFAADYALNEEAMLYASVSKGFKAGGFNRANAATSVTVDPETSIVYEIGAKTQWWDRRVQVNASAFLNEHEGFQSSLFVPVTPTLSLAVLQNLPKVEIIGGEIEIQAVPIDRLLIAASIGLLDSEITEVLPGNEALLGNELPMAEDRNFSGLVRYDVVTGLGTFSPQVNWKYRGEYWSSKENRDITGKLGDFWTTDVKIGYESTNRRVFGVLYVRNVLDEVQPIISLGARAGNEASAGTTTSKINERRNWGLTVGYRF